MKDFWISSSLEPKKPKRLSLAKLIIVLSLCYVAFGANTLYDLTTQVKGILPALNGGTGSQYFAVLGPTTSRSYTFPDANATIMSTTTGVTATQLPNPGAASLGGVQSKDCSGSGANYRIQKINTDGTITCADQAASTINFMDLVTPTGTINGVNATFTLAQTPNPVGSLKLYRNGQLLTVGAGNDYTVSGTTITMLSTAIPKTGDVLLAESRY